MSNHHTGSDLSATSSNPSFVDRVDLETIASIAGAARARTTSLIVACTVDPVPKVGAFNAVWFIDFSDGVQWVFRTSIVEWSPIVEKRLQSDMIGMQLIRNRTSIPIPLIHDFSIIPENAFGRPYMLMERAKGTPLSNLWFDATWFAEDKRKTVFKSLVYYMSQLQTLEFPSIGSLYYDVKSKSHIVGPLLPSFDDIENGDTATRGGPYNSVHVYLLSEIARQISSAPSMGHKVSLALLRMFSGALPDETLDGPPFVLSMPDFNYQNVFVDNDGNVTGLLDWDGMVVGPRQGGYARYPSWITRDWDPLLYGYPSPESVSTPQREDSEDEAVQGEGSDDEAAEDKIETPASSQLTQFPFREQLEEDSPSTLQAFREEYLAIFTEADPVSARYTRYSHIFEALEIAISTAFCRGHIIDRLSKYVFGRDAESGESLSAWHLEQGIEDEGKHLDVYGFVKAMYEGRNVDAVVDVWCDAPVKTLWKEYADAAMDKERWAGLEYWFALGVHPYDAKNYDDNVEKDILEAMAHPRCVGWGEIGLDYRLENSPREIQQAVFARQLKQAVRLDKPLVIHTREADDDTERILKAEVPKDHKVCIITYATNKNTAAVIRDMVSPFESSPDTTTVPPSSLRILLETDAPFMIPGNLYDDLRKIGRKKLPISHSAMIPWTAKFVADIANRVRIPMPPAAEAAVVRYQSHWHLKPTEEIEESEIVLASVEVEPWDADVVMKVARENARKVYGVQFIDTQVYS
ncbi:hypothetical protein GALMADRAFT_212641 [Galerina marginata CBS 339.88]|uniref:Aminoglycoside phosphotransferase domain-containing protein n=1 Tax=Galerina marginata (strain CBS 339.88) TaxID=685588 RepID=A0A067SQJ4_GALM3|nr:hypothetical protein GALMADRAFT_212641 [Galerina marginata CBS 339.88]